MNSTAAKLGASIALVAFLGFSAAGCSASAPSDSSSSGASKTDTAQVEEEAAPEPVSLEGEWKQNNSNDPENSWQSAKVTGDTIEVYWVANAGDTTSLYWAGSIEVPADGESFTFDSVNDTAKTEASMLASGDATKTFTYENDELSYEVTALGTTMTVRLSRE